MIVYANCHSADNSAVLAMSDAATLLINSYAGAAASGSWLEVPAALPLRPLTNGFAFDYLTLIGVRYRVESSFDLMNWITNNGANGQIAASPQSSFSDTNPATMKFFRAHLMT